ncbi:MAG: TadE/TadG family type IV pilus assembly protein [Acidobacteriota bacterium]
MRSSITGTSLARRLLHLRREESGSELVEFAVASLLLLMVLFSIFDLCRAMYSYYFVSYAAQQGARYAMVRGSGWSSNCSTSSPPGFAMNYGCTAASSDVQNYVQSLAMPGVNQSDIAVSTSWPGQTPNCLSNCSACAPSDKAGCMVNVQVSYTFNFMLPFLPKSALTFSGSAEKVIQE